jgi:Ca-activated chloride channel family protein
MRNHALAAVAALMLVIAGCAGGGGPDAAVNNPSGGNIGLAAGGAQDAIAFRNNVREGYVPQPTDMTAEGLFHDYYFDAGTPGECEQLFCPSYSRAVSTDPLSNETERYLTVGLNSGLSESEFEREKLNLVVVLDTSGSMSSSFREYYYDGGERKTVEDDSSKMAAARDAVVTLTDHLEGDDRFGMVTYSDDARALQPVRRVDETDMGSLETRVRGLEADGGTNLDAGMSEATSMLDPYRDANRSEYETRVVYVTDAMPNLADTSESSLGSRLESAASEGIHSTFVGVGVDFNTDLVESINEVRGANYYTVHSPDQFEERMDEGFDYMVTPLVFDLSLSVASEGYEIAQVYGSPSAEETSGELMEVTTLFPSRTEGNRTEGGVVLIELREVGEADSLRLTTSYETRTGESRESVRTVAFGSEDAPYYGSSGIRKAVALSRYADLMRNWAAYERARASGGAEDPPDGVEHRSDLGEWEQESVDLQVSAPYGERIETFESYFAAEREALGADRMERDADVLGNLLAEAGRDVNATATVGTG